MLIRSFKLHRSSNNACEAVSRMFIFFQPSTMPELMNGSINNNKHMRGFVFDSIFMWASMFGIRMDFARLLSIVSMIRLLLAIGFESRESKIHTGQLATKSSPRTVGVLLFALRNSPFRRRCLRACESNGRIKFLSNRNQKWFDYYIPHAYERTPCAYHVFFRKMTLCLFITFVFVALSLHARVYSSFIPCFVCSPFTFESHSVH